MSTRPQVGLFVTCLVDHFRPSVGFASAKLLRDAGCDVFVPPQTCCGQPAYNGGDPEDARALARNVIGVFEKFDYVVVPSGSCTGMIKMHYSKLLSGTDAWRDRADALAAKTFELTSFLHMRKVKLSLSENGTRIAYQDSCSSLREIGVRDAPRELLANTGNLPCELIDGETCCGFGGFFSIKFPEISARMADEKLEHVRATGAATLAGGDLGCLLHLAGRASRTGSQLRIRHVAEILAGDAGPAIGEPET